MFSDTEGVGSKSRLTAALVFALIVDRRLRLVFLRAMAR
jgi:hypothetical protein